MINDMETLPFLTIKLSPGVISLVKYLDDIDSMICVTSEVLFTSFSDGVSAWNGEGFISTN